jgi:hypothetical protein
MRQPRTQRASFQKKGNTMKKQLILALALAAAPFAASADGHSYTYVEGGYAQLNQELPQVEGFHIDDVGAGGFFVGGSAELGDTFHLFGSYRKGDDDVGVSAPLVGHLGDAGIDMSQGIVGLGYHHGLSQRTDLLAEVSYLSTEIDVEDDGEGSMDGDDFRVAVGVRHLIANNVDIWAKGNFTDGDVYDSAFSATLGLQYHLTPMWGIVGEAELGSEFSQVPVGMRASF